MISQFFTLAVDDTDVLQTAASQLRRSPGDGEYRMWYGSDQADGLLQVTAQGVTVVEEGETPVITVGVLDTSGPPLHSWKVGDKDEVVINYNEVTAGTATMKLSFLDMVDLLMEQGMSPGEIAETLGG